MKSLLKTTMLAATLFTTQTQGASALYNAATYVTSSAKAVVTAPLKASAYLANTQGASALYNAGYNAATYVTSSAKGMARASVKATINLANTQGASALYNATAYVASSAKAVVTAPFKATAYLAKAAYNNPKKTLAFASILVASGLAVNGLVSYRDMQKLEAEYSWACQISSFKLEESIKRRLQGVSYNLMDLKPGEVLSESKSFIPYNPNHKKTAALYYDFGYPQLKVDSEDYESLVLEEKELVKDVKAFCPNFDANKLSLKIEEIGKWSVNYQRNELNSARKLRLEKFYN